MTTNKEKITIFWFRRDLRLEDNAGLYYALSSEYPVLCLFIFDSEILDKLEDKSELRVDFIHRQLIYLDKQVKQNGSGLLVMHANPEQAFGEIIRKYKVHSVFTNHDYEPYGITRDNKIKQLLDRSGISFHTYKDQVIFEKDEILTAAGTPFKVYTPYKVSWLAKLKEEHIRPYNSAEGLRNLYQAELPEIPALEQIGFEKTEIEFAAPELNQQLIENYDKTRDFPSFKTSTIGMHLRHGTLSIRKAVKKGLAWNRVWLEELIWREFFMMVLYHNPQVVDHSFKAQYDRINWRNNEQEFERWCSGMTGYPIVDAGIRQMNQTGFMHNRVRMITASFLTKHLLIDWRWGEAYFAKKLLDYELSSNNGNWQWAAGTGTDAQPYFRVFNPWTQAEKFDKDKKYIRQWVKEYGTDAYPEPMVDHKAARERALEAYKAAVNP